MIKTSLLFNIFYVELDFSICDFMKRSNNVYINNHIVIKVVVGGLSYEIHSNLALEQALI